MDREVVARELVDSALKVRSMLGPGLLGSACEACPACELAERGIVLTRQKLLPIRCGQVEIDEGYRLDLRVDDQIVVELKTSVLCGRCIKVNC